MQIRDLERPLLPRLRGKDENPLRKTASELGAFLDRLSGAVRDAVDEEDTVDDSIREKNKNAAFRRFKMHSPLAEETAPLKVSLDTEQEEALKLLQEARSLAADAGLRNISIEDRISMQMRLDDIFREISTSRIAALLSLSSVASGADNDPLYSLVTPETSHEAYHGVEEMILKIYELGPRGENSGGISSEHDTAIDATERISEFLLNEGPANAFSRFREINRSNVLGLLK